jgi:uncharacterized membrane protein
MKPSTIGWAVLFSLLPISELRGSIPYLLANGTPVAAAFAICVAANLLVGPIAWLFLSTIHRLLSRWKPYAHAFDRIVERARRKVHAAVERWGYWGLAIFVGIPLPFTGAWTGALGAWVLGMEVRKSLAAIAAGVLIAGVLVTFVAFFGIRAFSIFLKG